MANMLDDEENKFPFAQPGGLIQPDALDPAKSQMVQEYIKNKYALSPEFSDEARQKLVAQNTEESKGPNWLAGLAGLGAAIAGRDSIAAGQNIIGMQKSQRDQRLSEFDKGRAQAIQGIDLAKQEERYKRETDPESAESKMAQELAIQMGMSPDQARGLTAEQFKQFSPIMQKRYELAERERIRGEDQKLRAEEQGLRRQDIALRRSAQEEQKQFARDEKQQKLETPYGLAKSEDDAKNLKEAHESKQKFDRQLDELIALRKEYGGEAANREAVSRAKQLSKDLLLEYKNMAKLGVLSQADEAIINAIIPSDPLAFTAAGLMGQDPILKNLESFKKDNQADFVTKVATRTRNPDTAVQIAGQQGQKGGDTEKTSKKIVQKLRSPSTGKTKIVYDDGTSEIINQAVAND